MSNDTTRFPRSKEARPESLVAMLVEVGRAPMPRRFRLELGENVVGKARDAAVCIAGSGISRHHACVLVRPGIRASVRDLGSTNGTWLNGREVVQEAALSDGDQLHLGAECIFLFRFERSGSSSSLLSSLTPRELEVSQLVARGMTNAAIADVLTVSAKTVSRHLENIYRKLDINSRAALTAYIVGRGLSRP